MAGDRMGSCILATDLDNWSFPQQPAGSKVVSLSVSVGHVALGLASGELQLYCRTKSEHVTLLWQKVVFDTCEIREIDISKDEAYIGLGGGSDETSNQLPGGVAVLEMATGAVLHASRLREHITALTWSACTLFAGGSGGGVAVLEVLVESTGNGGSRDPAATVAAPRQILALDSRVVQLEAEGDLLVGSTLSRAVICNNVLKSYREVGSKLRQGSQGVSMLADRLWAARPGCRLWEVDATSGAVLATRQYRKGLSELLPASLMRRSEQRQRERRSSAGKKEGEEGSAEGGRAEEVLKGREEHGFGLLHAAPGVLISSNSESRLYLLDMENSGLLAWTNLHLQIRQVSVCGDLIAVLDAETGRILRIRYGSLHTLVNIAFHLQLFDYSADILLQKRRLIRNLSEEGLLSLAALGGLPRKLTDFSKASKVAKLLDAVSRLASCRVDGSAAAPEVFRQPDIRSISRDRVGPRFHSGSSDQLTESMSLAEGRSQSQEELLEGSSRSSTNRRRRQLGDPRLSSSRKNMSASEQGLQALQLYNIKFGKKSPGRSETGSYRSSLESVNSNSTRSGAVSRLSAADSPNEELLEQVGEELEARLAREARHAGLNIFLQEDGAMRRPIVGRVEEGKDDDIKEDDIKDDDRPEAGPQAVDQDDAAVSELEAWLREEDKRREEANRLGKSRDLLLPEADGLTEANYALLEQPMGLAINLQGSEMLGEMLERLVERGETRVQEMVDTIIQGNSAFSSIIAKEVRLTGRQQRLEEAVRLSVRIAAFPEVRLPSVKALAAILLNIVHTDLRVEMRDEDDTNICLGLSRCLSEEQAGQLSSTLALILADPPLTRAFFIPLQEGLGDKLLPEKETLDYMYPKLVTLLDQPTVDLDILVSNALELFCDLLSPEELVLKLTGLYYYSWCYLLSLEGAEQQHCPALAPVRLDQIREENVYDCSNFLAAYQELGEVELLRYITHLLRLSADAALHLIQGHILSLRPESILYTVLFYNKILLEAILVEPDCSLAPAANLEWSKFFCRALASHIPGWPEEWRILLVSLPNLASSLAQAFQSVNEHLVGRTAGIAGAHKSQENLELAPLASFLINLQGVSGPVAQLAWYKCYSYMPGLVRCVLSDPGLAPPELPLLVEVGDADLLAEVGLLAGQLAAQLVDHVLAVYKPGECPLNWSIFSDRLLENQDAATAFPLLKRLSPLMRPGDITQKLYARLLMGQLKLPPSSYINLNC